MNTRRPAAAPASLAAAIDRLAARLRRARLVFGHGCASAGEEAAWIAAHVLRLSPSRLTAERLARPLPAAAWRRMLEIASERIATRKPLAYLLREAWFAGLRFYVDERVIVPRSLTGEFILERFAPWLPAPAARVRRILDMGTGSACMAVALARAFPRARVDAADLSSDALVVAAINVRRHRLARRIRLVRSDLFAALGGRRYDLIVSNPPYVSLARWRRLPPEYRHEPRTALVAGPQGIELVARLLAEAHAHLNPGGLLVVEVGEVRPALERAFPELPFVWLTSTSGDECVFLLTAEALSRGGGRVRLMPAFGRGAGSSGS